MKCSINCNRNNVIKALIDKDRAQSTILKWDSEGLCGSAEGKHGKTL